MKFLYCASYILTAPFWALGWLFYWPAIFFISIGDLIHDQTTYRAWLVLHKRKCKELYPDSTTCADCGEPMQYNVPRLGPAGGFVHCRTGNILCEQKPLWK